MTDALDPKTVREIARTFLTDPDADELKYVVRSYIGYAGGAEHEAWCDAVRADAEKATVTTTASWPDEQQQDDGDVRAVDAMLVAYVRDDADEIREAFDNLRDRFIRRIAELEVRDTQASLEARDAKAGEQR